MALSGCRSTPATGDAEGAAVEDTAAGGSAEDALTGEQHEIRRLEAELRDAAVELDAQAGEREALRATVTDLTETVASLREEIRRLESQLETVADAQDAEVSSLRAEREALLLDLARISNAAEIAASQAAARSGPGAIRGSSRDATDDSTAARALAEALAGLGGFREVPEFGYRADRRLTTRLAAAGTGLAVDSSSDLPVLFDTALDYTGSLIYLSVLDPAGPDPRLLLTTQYVSDVRPLYAQTAFISALGGDPVDPLEPIVFTGSPVRETDGTRLREAFTREVDRALLNRLSAMLSARGFSGTFVGTTGQEAHHPTLVEREAMSRVLFAFIDLGGL